MIPHTSNGIWTLAQVDIQSMYEEIRRGGIMKKLLIKSKN